LKAAKFLVGNFGSSSQRSVEIWRNFSAILRVKNAADLDFNLAVCGAQNNRVSKWLRDFDAETDCKNATTCERRAYGDMKTLQMFAIVSTR